MSSDVQFRPLYEFDFVEFADLFTRCFEDYVIPVKDIPPAAAAARSRREGIDHARSFVTMLGSEPVAIGLIAPRFEVGRLAGMGVVKAARGQGIGRATVEEFLRRLREEQFKKATLEVFEQNAPAVRLYESVGFRPTRRLLGFKRPPRTGSVGTELKAAPLSEFVEALLDAGDDLPFTHSPAQASAMALPLKCWTVDGDALACFVPPLAGQPVVVHAFIVRKSARGQGKGRALFDSIQGTYSGHAISMPQIFPESVAGFLANIGFERLELNQFEMWLEL
jgi:GNAT superfamily N-acetyltransferase